MRRIALNPAGMFVSGGLLGILSRILDIRTSNLGNIFSECSIWILFGVLISIYSKTKKQAMIHIFPFCIGMLITYYWMAEITHGVYSVIFIKGWTLFACISPFFAYFTWISKEKGTFPQMIRLGILVVFLFISKVLFDGPRFADWLIFLILIYFLYIKDIKR